jgi:hypothetical protein
VSATVKQAGSHPPKFLTSPKKLTVALGRVAYIELKAEDTDEDVLTFSSEAPLPKGVVLSQSPLGRAGLFWQPTPDQVGSHKIIFKVSDGKGGEDTLPIEVEVLPGGDKEKR